MRLYLDDDFVSVLLVQFLRRAGHDVRLPSELGLSGKHDAVHLRQAIRENRVLLSRNYGDFEFLHDLILEVKGHHPGIFVVRPDTNPKRRMKYADIVRAVSKLVAAVVPIADQYIILNHWR